MVWADGNDDAIYGWFCTSWDNAGHGEHSILIRPATGKLSGYSEVDMASHNRIRCSIRCYSLRKEHLSSQYRFKLQSLLIDLYYVIYVMKKNRPT